MKRCSQCHFTFDDVEQFCDFDNTELTPYPEAPPSPQTAQSTAPGSQSFLLGFVRSRVSLAILALGGVAVSALLIGYFDYASQGNVDNAPEADSGASESLVPSTTAAVELPAEAPVQPAVKTRLRNTVTSNHRIKDSSAMRHRPRMASRSRARLHSSSPVKKPTAALANAQQTKRFERAHPKEQSKVTAILTKTANVLKKTAGILKKPFEL
jgi:hypothetical protein